MEKESRLASYFIVWIIAVVGLFFGIAGIITGIIGNIVGITPVPINLYFQYIQEYWWALLGASALISLFGVGIFAMEIEESIGAQKKKKEKKEKAKEIIRKIEETPEEVSEEDTKFIKKYERGKKLYIIWLVIVFIITIIILSRMFFFW